MATNHTTNYSLNLWEPEDKFLRTEFNENSEKIDAALKAHNARIEAVAATVPKIKFGAYIGDGAETRLIRVGFTPQIVLVTTQEGYTHQIGPQGGFYGGVAARNEPARVVLSGTAYNTVEIVDGGFNVCYHFNGATVAATNLLTLQYHYIAIG